jgi:LacI family transcriptional regulator
VVWLYESMVAQSCLNGLYHRADQSPNVWVRKFRAEAPDFQREVLAPLRQWRPHGLILRMDNEERLRQLRRQFPTLPFVSTVMTPPGLVNTVVASNIINALGEVRDYFHKCGLSHVALFATAEESITVNVSAAFDQAVPGGHKLICPLAAAIGQTPGEKKQLKKIMTNGLRGLPKPVGVFTAQTDAAAILLEWCQKLGLRVPEEIQIIGMDEEDRCLECQPHLSSLAMPNERIGEMAFETMLSHLRHEQPPPLVRVSGITVISRGSTALLQVGSQNVAGTLDLMQTYALKGITASRLAKLSKVGRTTFYKHFTVPTGNTPARHLREVRLQKACQMLRETDMTVTAVAKACGFKCLVDFANFFRRQTGQSPTGYRTQMTHPNGPCTGK